MTYSGGAAPTSRYATPPMIVLAETVDEPWAPASPNPVTVPLALMTQWPSAKGTTDVTYRGHTPAPEPGGHGLYGVSIKAHGRHRKSGNKELPAS